MFYLHCSIFKIRCLNADDRCCWWKLWLFPDLNLGLSFFFAGRKYCSSLLKNFFQQEKRNPTQIFKYWYPNQKWHQVFYLKQWFVNKGWNRLLSSFILSFFPTALFFPPLLFHVKYTPYVPRVPGDPRGPPGGKWRRTIVAFICLIFWKRG